MRHYHRECKIHANPVSHVPGAIVLLSRQVQWSVQTLPVYTASKEYAMRVGMSYAWVVCMSYAIPVGMGYAIPPTRPGTVEEAGRGYIRQEVSVDLRRGYVCEARERLRLRGVFRGAPLSGFTPPVSVFPATPAI